LAWLLLFLLGANLHGGVFMRKTRAATLADTGLFHKMWQGHNREAVLNTIDEKRSYLKYLCDGYSDKIAPLVKWYSYCVMNNHPHETGSALGDPCAKIPRRDAIGRLGDWMRNAHSRFGAYYNRKHGRGGAVNNGRPKTAPIKSDMAVLNVMFYADANPVRGGIVRHPTRYPWSSCNYYCTGEHNEVTRSLTPPPAYIALGKTAGDRRSRYRSLLDAYLRMQGLLDDAPSEEVAALSDAVSMEVAIAEVMALANRTRGGP
jgi:putative transposase